MQGGTFMRNLMKLMAVVAVVAMMTGVAFAATIEAQKGTKEIKNPQASNSRGALDCSGLTELTNPYSNPFMYMPAVGNVDDYFGASYFIWTGGEVVFHYTFPASADGWDWNFTWVHPAGGYVDWFYSTTGCGEEFVEGLSWGTLDSGGSVTGTGGWDGEIWMWLDGEYGFGDFFFDASFSAWLYIPFDFCADVIDVTGTGIFVGDTCDGYNTPAGTCVIIPPTPTQYLSDGQEDYYGVFMPAGSTFQADVIHTCDASLRVMDACLEPVNCVGYMDAVYPDTFENMPFTNDTGVDALFYLVIDAYDDCCGTYELNFTSGDGAIANEAMTMGEVKALWR